MLGFRNTSGNLKFLTEWHSHEKTSCTNNPVSASKVWLAASLCHGGPKRNYRTRSDGAQATAAQLKEPRFSAIYDALKSGHPFHVADNQAVVSALELWGSAGFAAQYATQGAPAPAKQSPVAPQALKGWSDIQRTVGRGLPAALHQSDTSIRRALRSLGRARKVKL